MIMVSGDMTGSDDHSTASEKLSINKIMNTVKSYPISQDKNPSHPEEYQTNDTRVWWYEVSEATDKHTGQPKKAFWKFLFVLSVLFPLSLAVPLPSPDPDPDPDAAPAAYASDYTHYVPAHAVAQSPSSQYHAQDNVGQYNFGFTSPDQTKQEVKTADGVIRGAYSYVDANGIVQSVNYIADALGFRVAATNLPVHDIHAEPTVAAEPKVAQVAPAVAVEAKPAMTAKIDYAYLPYAQGYDYNVAPSQYVQAPVVQAQPALHVFAAAPTVQNTQYIQYAAPVVQSAPVVKGVPIEQAPIVHTAPVVAPASEYHIQDQAGQYSFGYQDPHSVKQEVKTADGVVRGAYRYIDTNGIVQMVEYIADALGFRVGATNLPVHVVDSDVAPIEPATETSAALASAPAPAPVLSPSQTPGPAMTPSVSYAYLPYATNYGYNVPVVPVDHQEDPDRSRSSPEGLTELDYHSEAARLASGRTWELTFISPADFARAGFYSLNQHDSCRCAFCHNCVGDWVEGDDPMTEHRALFPLCPFVQGHEVGNIPLEVQGEGGHQPTRQSPGNDETGIRWNSNHTEPNTTPEKAPYGASPESIGIMKHAGPLHPQYAALEARLRTFREWPPALRQQPKQLAEAEFYYIGLSDQVKCFYCDGGLRNWQSEDEPWVEHARWFSRCVFIRLVVKHQQSIRTPNPPGKPAIPRKSLQSPPGSD